LRAWCPHRTPGGLTQLPADCRPATSTAVAVRHLAVSAGCRVRHEANDSGCPRTVYARWATSLNVLTAPVAFGGSSEVRAEASSLSEAPVVHDQTINQPGAADPLPRTERATDVPTQCLSSREIFMS
jgi:hypothetical protein